MPSKIAVCLAAYNGLRFLPEQLNSILQQTGVLVTLFVSVDVSSDGTEAWFDKQAKEDDRIVVLPHGQRFGGAALNFFRLVKDIDFTAFDYVAFADQDDIWLPNKLLRAHEVMEVAGAEAYSSNVTAFWPDGRKMMINKAQAQTKWDFLFEAAGPGCTYVLSRKLAQDIQSVVINRWDDMQTIGLHDWFFYAFARASDYRWMIDNFSGMLYRQHDKNQVGVNSGLAAVKNRACTVINGWGLSQASLIANVIGLGNNSFVRRWSSRKRLALLNLALHAYQCRRRTRDKILFGLSCLLLSIIGSRGK